MHRPALCTGGELGGRPGGGTSGGGGGLGGGGGGEGLGGAPGGGNGPVARLSSAPHTHSLTASPVEASNRSTS